GIGAGPIGSIEVAHRGVAGVAVDIGAHLLTFAREVELFLRAETLARGLAGSTGVLPGDQGSRELALLVEPLVAIHAEAHRPSPVLEAGDRPGVAGALVGDDLAPLRGDVLVSNTTLLGGDTVLPGDELHALAA